MTNTNVRDAIRTLRSVRQFKPEPLPDDSPLWGMANVVLTPHVAGSIGTEIDAMTRLVIDEIGCFTRGEALEHEVAADSLERAA